jgi:hypothetical protein
LTIITKIAFCEDLDQWLRQYRLGLLSYLYNTADEKLKKDVNKLESKIHLNQIDAKTLKDIAQFEGKEILKIKMSDYKWKRINEKEDFEINKNEYINQLNKKIESLRRIVTEKIIELLGRDKYDIFLQWAYNWQNDELDYRNNKIKSLYNANQLGVMACYVFATQFELDEIGVALPDKYIKFANLGWPIPDKYKKYYSSPPYKIEIVRGDVKEEFEIRDVGPWNEDDNYWDLPEWLNIGSGPYRRTFNELSICMPEARAAFERNFNNGLDQFGRKVLNPAGVDLTFEAAKMLGLEYLENAWVTIFIDKLP